MVTKDGWRPFSQSMGAHSVASCCLTTFTFTARRYIRSARLHLRGEGRVTVHNVRVAGQVPDSFEGLQAGPIDARDLDLLRFYMLPDQMLVVAALNDHPCHAPVRCLITGEERDRMPDEIPFDALLPEDFDPPPGDDQ